MFEYRTYRMQRIVFSKSYTAYYMICGKRMIIVYLKLNFITKNYYKHEEFEDFPSAPIHAKDLGSVDIEQGHA